MNAPGDRPESSDVPKRGRTLPSEVRKAVRKEAVVIGGLSLIFLAPALWTLFTATEPRPFAYSPVSSPTNPTPFGYTFSLGLFLLPSLVFGRWFLTQKHSATERKAFLWTLVILSPLGFILDVIFGELFLNFKNPGAVVRLYLYRYYHLHYVPTYDLTRNVPQYGIPVEEFVFYISGFVAILSLYVWAAEYWLAAYQAPDADRNGAKVLKLVSFRPKFALWGLVLFALAYGFKKYGPHTAHDGFPGYFLFLLCCSIVPSILLFNVAVSFVNWRAFSLVFFFVLAVSQFWEATLGVPYRWWGYENKQMIGIFLKPLSDLPIEAAIVWVAATWTTVLLYETLHTLMHLTPDDRLRVFHLLKSRHLARFRRSRSSPDKSSPTSRPRPD